MSKNILLITPMLHQGGFERICVQTAYLLSQEYHVTIAMADWASCAMCCAVSAR